MGYKDPNTLNQFVSEITKKNIKYTKVIIDNKNQIQGVFLNSIISINLLLQDNAIFQEMIDSNKKRSSSYKKEKNNSLKNFLSKYYKNDTEKNGEINLTVLFARSNDASCSNMIKNKKYLYEILR